MIPQYPHSEWQVPPATASETYRLGWLNEAAEEGQAWNESQRGFRDWRKGLDIISGQAEESEIIQYRSHLTGKRLKTNIQTVVSGLSAIRPLWGYHSGKQYKDYALMMNKTTRAIYLENFWDQSIKEVLQYASIVNTGWARPVYQRDQAGRGVGKLLLLTYGQPCVLPLQMPSNGDYQEAYAVTLLDEMPIFMAHSKFPDYQDRLKPTSSQYWYSIDIRESAKGNLWKRMFQSFRRKKDARLSDLYIPIRYTTVIDLSINTSGHTIPMGEAGSTWYYEVPSYGSEIPDSYGGRRKATQNDARMYPYRRLIISSQNCIMYDGPSFNWHGELDLVPFTLDRWPWEPMGFSLCHDGYQLQKSIDEIDRGTMDKINAQQDLPLGYDINAVTRKEAGDFDPMQPRARIGFDGSAVDKPFAPPVPPEIYQVTKESLEFKKELEQALDYLMQTRDIVELGKARALGKGMDQLEALIAAQGPVVKDMSRAMERSLSRLGNQIKYLVLQWLDSTRLMQFVGEDGITQEVFDYDPVSIVPSHMPGEMTTDANEKEVRSIYPRMQRARWFAENLRFFLLPHSVHEITQMTYRLLLLQMKQRGAPIDWGTIFQACDIPDSKLEDGNYVQDRYYKEQEDAIIHAARMQKIVEGLGINPQAVGGGGKPNGSGKHGGRPPSGNAPPQVKQKGDGRPTVTESQ